MGTSQPADLKTQLKQLRTKTNELKAAFNSLVEHDEAEKSLKQNLKNI